ncbi:hypothetical protein PsaNZ64_21080 [Pseudomonas syringae pv. actinidiae]|uniref:Uncharacterized protein n=1 Tax=Pseudomonas syringae pv. actinidiae TaxID=103796 RepID=A0A2P0QFX2_PSESF|nr:hypothetical protein [Pseudomonas syringae]ARO45292.1 hypothetical protein [Pseudomonas syringae pv. actinidiae]OKS70527.1 hypothetical protein PsaNZ64_21080 [Pseudomonas syringae pv. actinidiae]
MSIEHVLSVGIPLATFFFLLSLLFLIDAKRLRRHIDAATALMDQGVPESEAIQRTGCNHWKHPFWLRIWKKYPKLSG